MKLTKNDIEILQTKVRTQEKQNAELNEKSEMHERKIQQLKDQNMKIQKERDQIEISLNNKIEILQYKLLNGTKESSKMNGEGDQNAADQTFKELLVLSRGEISDLTKKIASLQQNDKVEDNLRGEIIEQGRKMNELRSEHEQQMYQL